VFIYLNLAIFKSLKYFYWIIVQQITKLIGKKLSVNGQRMSEVSKH